MRCSGAVGMAVASPAGIDLRRGTGRCGRAVAGWQDRTLGSRPVYVMPSTSGLNAHSTQADLTAHLRTAANSTT